MKKLAIIIMIALSISFVAGAIAVGTILTRQQVDNIDYTNVDLNCEYDYIWLKVINGKLTLTSKYNCFDLEPAGDGNYEIANSNLVLTYNDEGFFTCIRVNHTQIDCFEDYVKPKWDNEILNYQYYLRMKLKSIQDDYPFIINKDLVRYYK